MSDKKESSTFVKIIVLICIVLVGSFIVNNCTGTSKGSVYDDGEYQGVLRGRD